MNAPTPATRIAVVEQVRRKAASGLRGAALLSQLNGLHPIDVKSALTDAGEPSLLEATFSGLNATGPVIHEIIREDNPALSFWPFTPQTTSEIAKFVGGKDSVALLGVPSLFKALNSREHSNSATASLFDADTYFVSDETEGFFRCDISDMPTRYYARFDAVVADPPWYVEEYHRWLRVASKLCRPGGTLLFVLFPEAVRSTAIQERRNVLEIVSRYFTNVRKLPLKVRYQTPSFEQVQMLLSGIQPIDWRTAELIEAQSPRQQPEVGQQPQAKPTEWHEHRVGSGRVFIRRDNPEKNSSGWLEPAERDSRFLRSPTRRSIAATRCNVLSSRGHGLVCAEPDRLSDLLIAIHEFSDAQRLTCTIPEASQSLFATFVRDLWGRYILL